MTVAEVKLSGRLVVCHDLSDLLGAGRSRSRRLTRSGQAAVASRSRSVGWPAVSRQRAKERGLPANQRKAPPRLVEGATTTNWKAALGTLTLAYPDRLAHYIN
jgi:hypothetical protein